MYLGDIMISYFYSPYVDAAVCIISIAMLIVLSITYTRKNFYFRVLYIGIINICAASIASAQYNYLLKHIGEFNNLIVYAVHDIFYTLLISIWVLFIIYVYALSVGVKNRERIKKFIIFLH